MRSPAVVLPHLFEGLLRTVPAHRRRPSASPPNDRQHMAGITAPHPRYSRLINSRPCQLNGSGWDRSSGRFLGRKVPGDPAICGVIADHGG